MEAINDKKRKKRKTRRCLDELRKKTHEPNNECKVNYNTDAKLPNNKSNCIKNNYLTTNRLTLLNKAVRSETVTRYQVSELEGENFEINKDKQTINSHTNILSENNNNNNAIALETQIQHNTEDEMEFLSPNLNKDNEIETPKSIMLFSPESEKEEAINTTLDSPLETSLISSSPPTRNTTISTRNTDIEEKELCEIMNGLRTYMVENFPQLCLMPDDYKEVTRANIARVIYANQKIYASLSPEILEFYKTRYNPGGQIDGIGYRWNYDDLLRPDVQAFYDNPYSTPVPKFQVDRVPVHCHCESRGTQESSPSHCESRGTQESSPSHCESRGTQESSPMDRTSGSSTPFEIYSTSPVVSGIYDTPEYTFYPHRLN